MHELLIPISRYTECMNPTYPLASIGELIGEPARATILVYLLDGCARTAGELAFTANISAQSASAHLSKLVDGGLLAVESSGRHRYYKLAGPEVALALEALGAIASKPQPAALKRPSNDEMFRARSCYDHLAGRVAVELAQRLEDRQVIHPSGKRDYELGSEGRNWLAAFGIDVDRLRRTRRCFARKCIDWTERRPHLAGALGAALCSRLIALGWIARRRDTRAVRITAEGARQLRARLSLAL
jgi:DNA-binding transcriptional ArsR family regulator